MRLPLDIVNAVLEAAYYDQGRADYRTLGTCALVCKDWAAHAQRLHFRWLSVRSTECAASLCARILEPDTARARALRNCVRVLEVGTAVELDFAADALAKCAFVYELRIETVQEDVPARLLAHLQSSAHSLRTLRLAAPGSRPLRQLLRALPALARVEATIQRFDLPDGDAEWPPHLCPDGGGDHDGDADMDGAVIRELRLHAETVTLDARPSFEALVEAACGPSLEALSLASADFLPPLGSYVESLANLRSLGLDRWNDPLAHAVAELPALRELQFWKPAVIRTGDALFDTLPPRLVHLSIPGGDAFTADRLALEAAAIPRLRARLPALAVLTVYATGRAALGPWARMLAAYCAHLGIHFHLRNDKEMLYETDLIPCTAFPRYREAANYSYMAPVAVLPASVEDLVSTLPRYPSHSHEGESLLPHGSNPSASDVAMTDVPAPPALTPVPLPAIDEEPAQETPVRTKSKSASVRSRLRRVMHKLKVILPRPVRSRA